EDGPSEGQVQTADEAVIAQPVAEDSVRDLDAVDAEVEGQGDTAVRRQVHIVVLVPFARGERPAGDRMGAGKVRLLPATAVSGPEGSQQPTPVNAGRQGV